MNRYWAHFFGRGIVEPPDDMRLTNPPSNPALLDGLAERLRQKRLRSQGAESGKSARAACTVFRAYRANPTPTDRQSFARHYPRRMGAEVLLDAIAQVSGVATAFDGLPGGTRAIDLPDESVGSTFLDAFGRPKRETSCECERVTDASLSQSLMLLNSGEVQTKLSSPGSRADKLAKDPRTDQEKIDELFWDAFGRRDQARSLERDRAPRGTRSQPANCVRGHHLGIDQRQGVSVRGLTRREALSGCFRWARNPMHDLTRTWPGGRRFNRRGFLKAGCLGTTGLTLSSCCGRRPRLLRAGRAAKRPISHLDLARRRPAAA